MSDKKISELPALSVLSPTTALVPVSQGGVTYNTTVDKVVPTMSATVGGAVPTPPNDATKVLQGDGTWGPKTAGTGTVSTVSVTTANGFGGTVTNPTTTPAIAISTNVIGLLKGNGSGVSAATGPDLPVMTSVAAGAVPTPPNSTTQYLRGDGTWAVPAVAGAGTVTNFSIVAANGFGGSVTNPTTVPALTLTTNVNGMVRGNGTAISVALDGTDYISPTTGDARYAKMTTHFSSQNYGGAGGTGINLTGDGTWTNAQVAYAINAPIKAYTGTILGPTPGGFGATGVTAAVMGEARYDFNSQYGEVAGGYFCATGIGTPGPAPSDIVGVSGTASKYNAAWAAGGHFDVYDHTSGGTAIGVNIELSTAAGTNTIGVNISPNSTAAGVTGISFQGTNTSATYDSLLNASGKANYLARFASTNPMWSSGALGSFAGFVNIKIDTGTYAMPVFNSTGVGTPGSPFALTNANNTFSGNNTYNYGILFNSASGSGLIYTNGSGSATSAIDLNNCGGVTYLLSMASGTGPFLNGSGPTFVNARIKVQIDGVTYYIPLSTT